MKDIMQELKDKAKIIAEGTGRTYESVLEDLLDDGVVNLSNEQLKQGSLVEQLKEAAELIATVQNISKEVEKNTVLNGRDVTTEVEVNSTLEGDCVDRAIESVQRKADNIKKILLTLAPVFLLLTTGGMEYFAITDFVGSGEEGSVEYGGCMADDAINYDPDASWDDESCQYLIIDPYCVPELIYSNLKIEADSDTYNWVTLYVDFEDENDCDEVEIEMSMELFHNDETYHYMGWGNHGDIQPITSGSQYQQYSIQEDFMKDLPDGEWYMEWGARIINNEAEFEVEENTDIITIVTEDECHPDILTNGGNLVREDPEDLTLQIQLPLYDGNACDPSQVEAHFDIYLDGEHMEGPVDQTDTIIGDSSNPTIFVYTFDPEQYEGREPYGDWTVECNWTPAGESVRSCEDTLGPITIDEPQEPCAIVVDNMAASLNSTDPEQDAITISFYLAVQEETDCTDDVKITYKLDDGSTLLQHQVTTTMQDALFEYTFDNVPIGTWHPILRIDDENGNELEGDDVADVEVKLLRCDITLYDINMFYNNTTAAVVFDLDCGDDQEAEGFNVSVQFWAVVTNTTETVNYTVCLHYIQGPIGTLIHLELANMTSGTYDFKWIAIWVDEEGETHNLLETWSNIVI